MKTVLAEKGLEALFPSKFDKIEPFFCYFEHSAKFRLVAFLVTSAKPLILAPFFARSLTLVPRSLLPNRTETLATQARAVIKRHGPWFCPGYYICGPQLLS